MNINLSDYPQLQSVLKQNKTIVYLCGAGLSMALGSHKYNWDCWIVAASKYMPAADSEHLEELLNENVLIAAAGYAIKKTKESGTYDDYMNATIGSLKVKDESLAYALQSINRAGDFIATTNYDLLIEQSTGLDAYTYTQSGSILKSLKGDAERKIIHLHGLYDLGCETDDIIADSRQYESVVANQGAQFIQNLLSTNTIIVIGCGATMDDPNLSGFLSFAQKQLGISVPYFYLYKNDKPGTTLALPDNFIPVSYGDDYNELSGFMNEIALYRLNHLAFSKAIRVNPYVDTGKKGSAYGRLHFANEFSRFTRRDEEMKSLKEFTYCDPKICWWAVTGKGGFGKSRLLLEWLKRLPNDWFGFFGETNYESINEYQQFRPFNNTIIVLDYVLGNEIACASIISTMSRVFAGTFFKLRIVLVDRFHNDSKIGWYDTLLKALKPQEKIEFIDGCYTGEKLVPLEIRKLAACYERKHIENYLESYVSILAETLKSKYTNCFSETAAIIHENFCASLGDEYHRPLFLNIFVEVWISKDGELDVDNVRDLLGQFLEKEAERWFQRLGNDNKLLYAYQILLAFAAASQLYVLQHELDIYQKHSDKLLDFIEAEKVAGKRKKSLDDIFMYQEYARNYDSIGECTEDEFRNKIQIIENDPDYLRRDESGAPVLLTILAPKYPDIICEFIVDYYIDREEWLAFAQEVRDYENFWFNTFLVRGMEDFPNTESFKEMYFAPLKDPRDTFGFTIGALSYVREFAEQGNLPRIIETLNSAGMSEDFGIYELELWRRIAIVYSERREYQELFFTGLQFVDYVKRRKQICIIIENLSEIIEIFCTELLKAQQYKLSVKLIKRFDGIAYDGYTAATCSRIYHYLINYQLHYGSTENVIEHLKAILQHLREYPEDDDIAVSFVNATDEIMEIINQNADVTLLNELVPVIEQAYDCSNSEKIAEVLAISEATRFFENTVDNNRSLVKKSRKRVNDLFRVYKDNGDVILSYASITAFIYLEELRYITDKELDQFKSWKDSYPERVGLLEAYGKILLTKWFNLTETFDEDNAKTVFREVESIAGVLAEQYDLPDLLLRIIQIRGTGYHLY